MKKCSVYGSGHAYTHEGGVYECPCGRIIKYDEITRRWYVKTFDGWMEDDQQ